MAQTAPSETTKSSDSSIVLKRDKRETYHRLELWTNHLFFTMHALGIRTLKKSGLIRGNAIYRFIHVHTEDASIPSPVYIKQYRPKK